MPSLPSPHLLSLFFSFSLLILLHPSSAAPRPSQLVDSVCKNTTNYAFCIQSLYSDSRTPTADRYVLAYVSFDLAYLNATHTRDYIANLLKNGTKRNGSADTELARRLQRCKSYYDKAVMALADAIGDLDSETFFELGSLASDADRAAKDCEATFKARKSNSDEHKLLSRMNGNLRGLCKICVVVSKLFTTS